jgi:GT2 family glycosyltransferase
VTPDGDPSRLGIVIPTVGRVEILERTLDHLARQRVGSDLFEVALVHGEGSDTDALEAMVAGLPYRVHRLSSSASDASSQRNVGWRALSTALILFLGDDILASPRLIAAHLEAHRRHAGLEVGVLGHVRWSRRPRPTPFMRWLEHGIQFDYRGLRPGQEAHWWRFYTANASVKRELLERVNGFDAEHFPFGYEDLDLGARMADHGFRLIYEPAATAEHLHPQTLEDWRQRVWRIAVSERAFCDRHPGTRPYFWNLFAEAAAHPPARRRGARLAKVVPPGLPWLGPRTWASYDLWNRQQLAPAFLEAWETAGSAVDPEARRSRAPRG